MNPIEQMHKDLEMAANAAISTAEYAACVAAEIGRSYIPFIARKFASEIEDLSDQLFAAASKHLAAVERIEEETSSIHPDPEEDEDAPME